MNILVIGGMHGNEPLGISLVKLLNSKPITGVNAVLANNLAIKAKSRYIKGDLNRSFPGNIASQQYEIRQAAELLDLCRGYDVVLDFHNTHSPGNDCGFVGEQADPKLYQVASFLGLRRIILADYECINKYAPNCLSVEISLNSKHNNTEEWYRRIVELSQSRSLLPQKKVTKYRFVYRMTLKDKDSLRLPDHNLKAFKSIDVNLATAMGVTSPAYPIFVADKYTPYNYGGLLNRVD